MNPNERLKAIAALNAEIRHAEHGGDSTLVPAFVAAIAALEEASQGEPYQRIAIFGALPADVRRSLAVVGANDLFCEVMLFMRRTPVPQLTSWRFQAEPSEGYGFVIPDLTLAQVQEFERERQLALEGGSPMTRQQAGKPTESESTDGENV